MKIRSLFLAVVITIILSLLGTFLGASAGLLLCSRFFPPWRHYNVTPSPGATDIVQVEIKYALTDPTEDVLYVSAEGAQLFSNTLFQKDWYSVEAAPKNDYEFPKCATDWKDHPPIKSGVIDSAGVRFERPLSTILRCYVLYKNGTMQVWTRVTDVFSWMTAIAVGGLLGLITGITIGVSFVRNARKPMSIITENAS